MVDSLRLKCLAVLQAELRVSYDSLLQNHGRGLTHEDLSFGFQDRTARLAALDSLFLTSFKVTMHLHIDNFLQIWIFESKYWAKCEL